MNRIKVLDEQTINKIAAGEVVERPASIIKELVENSIDAGSNEISVEILDGGISFIRVTDNGRGLYADDMENAFLRHATSKIKNHMDLTYINTLGFRGEALASIASVSKVDMISKTSESSIGYKICIEGGNLINKEVAGAPQGTVITVKDVFFNTPARLKFLKSQQREGMYVTDVMQNLALSHENISFKYKSKDKMIFATKGDGDLKSAILSIYGKETVNNLLEVDYSGDLISVKGFIGNSNLSKSNRNYQSTFINGRFIKNKTITAAVEAAYKSMLTINKFPFFVLQIYTNPEFIDVNVHPAKLEVKFQDDQIIFKSIYHCIKDCLLKISPILDVESKKAETSFAEFIPRVEYKQQRIEMDKPPLIKERMGDNIKDIQKLESTKENLAKVNNHIAYKTDIINNESNSDRVGDIPKFEPLAIVGQLHFTYIIAEGIDEMYLIDQHAAHERIYYEKYMKELKNSSIQSQNLLVPIVVELSPIEKQSVFENIDFINKIGFEIEDFGGNSIALRCVPVVYGNPDNKELFYDIIGNMEVKNNDFSLLINKTIYTMACKSAVKAGDKLNYREMSELIERLRYCDNPYTCPHGRPTIIKMSYNELEKKFKRIQ